MFQEGVEISKSLTEGGSLSDSGISDEGSELELSERERRLAHLKRLARALEQAAGDSHGPMLHQLNQVSTILVKLKKKIHSFSFVYLPKRESHFFSG